jgi:hypothetical protein
VRGCGCLSNAPGSYDREQLRQEPAHRFTDPVMSVRIGVAVLRFATSGAKSLARPGNSSGDAICHGLDRLQLQFVFKRL